MERWASYLSGEEPATPTSFRWRAPDRMVRVAISMETLLRHASAGVGHKHEADERGEHLIWLDRVVVDRLSAMRGPGES